MKRKGWQEVSAAARPTEAVVTKRTFRLEDDRGYGLETRNSVTTKRQTSIMRVSGRVVTTIRGI